jgi:hypothetical protein
VLQPYGTRQNRGPPIAGLLALAIAAIGLLFAWMWWHGEGVALKIQQVAAASPAQPDHSRALNAHLADPRQVLTRRDLVTFVRLAGAAKLADRERLQAAVAGRRFRVEVPLGCGSGVSFGSSASGRWWYDDVDRAIRLQALPDIWASADGHKLTSVRVFWITRPRRGPPDCPARTDNPSATPTTTPARSAPRIGLATASATIPRGGLSDETSWYSSAVRATPSELPELAPNLRLRIEGTVERDPPDGVTVCKGSSVRSAPDCAIASRIDRVAFVNARSGALLAQWRLASGN